eukprot:COSAG05_NODE_130_length_17165_cov_154.623638_6_plen_238_part_00
MLNVGWKTLDPGILAVIFAVILIDRVFARYPAMSENSKTGGQPYTLSERRTKKWKAAAQQALQNSNLHVLAGSTVEPALRGNTPEFAAWQATNAVLLIVLGPAEQCGPTCDGLKHAAIELATALKAAEAAAQRDPESPLVRVAVLDGRLNALPHGFPVETKQAPGGLRSEPRYHALSHTHALFCMPATAAIPTATHLGMRPHWGLCGYCAWVACIANMASGPGSANLCIMSGQSGSP